MLQHLLRKNGVTLDLEADSREEALARMVAYLPHDEIGLEDRETLLQLLLQREHFGTTAVGEGIAMPHCTFSRVSFPVAVLGVSQQGIPYPSLDGEPVHIIFLCIFPQVADVALLKRRILQPVERILRDSFFRERLRHSADPQAAYDLMVCDASAGLPTLRVAS